MNICTSKAGRLALTILTALVMALLFLPATIAAQTSTATPPATAVAQTPEASPPATAVAQTPEASPPAATVAQTSTVTSTAPADGTPAPGSVESTVNEAVDSVAARTPIPTPTPGFVQQQVAGFTERRGLDDITFLGLSAAEWIDLVLSVVIFALTYWVVAWFFGRVLRRLVRHTQTQFDDQFFATVEKELKWLLGVLLLRYSVLRLTFISDGWRTLLDDFFFILALALLTRIAIKLIDFGLDWYENYLNSEKRESTIDPVIEMLKNAGKLLVYTTSVSIALSHFGLISNAAVIVLVAIAVVALFSIRDIMTDVIYGFIILVGQPFRVDDAIHIDSMEDNDWGTVAEIGSRETHIRTRDNRMLVIPNASLASGQIINYMFPDPTYRVQTDLFLAYESGFDRIQPLLEQAARGVEGVLPDKPVDVLYWQFNRFGYTVRVRWWIANCVQADPMKGRVNAALVAALAAADVRIGYATDDVHVDGKLDEPPSPSS